MAAFLALNRSHFAQKINANLSQIFENTAIQTIFFKFFLLTMAIFFAFRPTFTIFVPTLYYLI